MLDEVLHRDLQALAVAVQLDLLRRHPLHALETLAAERESAVGALVVADAEIVADVRRRTSELVEGERVSNRPRHDEHGDSGEQHARLQQRPLPRIQVEEPDPQQHERKDERDAARHRGGAQHEPRREELRIRHAFARPRSPEQDQQCRHEQERK